ncbi:hypothetical protein ACLOJK_002696 [Asimina triloba]
MSLKLSEVYVEEAVESLSREILTIQAKGDKNAAKRLLEEYGKMTQPLHQAMEKLEKIQVPVDIAPIFGTIEKAENVKVLFEMENSFLKRPVETLGKELRRYSDIFFLSICVTTRYLVFAFLVMSHDCLDFLHVQAFLPGRWKWMLAYPLRFHNLARKQNMDLLNCPAKQWPYLSAENISPLWAQIAMNLVAFISKRLMSIIATSVNNNSLHENGLHTTVSDKARVLE